MKQTQVSVSFQAQPLLDALAELRTAAFNVIDHWESGDLAASVRELNRVLKEQKDNPSLAMLQIY